MSADLFLLINIEYFVLLKLSFKKVRIDKIKTFIDNLKGLDEELYLSLIKSFEIQQMTDYVAGRNCGIIRFLIKLTIKSKN